MFYNILLIALVIIFFNNIIHIFHCGVCMIAKYCENTNFVKTF